MKLSQTISHIRDGVQLILPYIQAPADKSRPFLIAIDGRCASGKTTLSNELSQAISCPVIHMDHFFLPPPMRTKQRLSQPGGNVDRERFTSEVLSFLKSGSSFAYRPFECHTCSYGAPITIEASSVVIIEGSYACHPELRQAYDLTVFMSVSPDIQSERIKKRNGKDAAAIFSQKWIPLEEAYFSAFDISNHCDLMLHTTFT